ncbi:acyl-CoA thioesterase [Sandarakinorhabdus sp. AAP62]|uniref:acyl-CoA thioesterase n=1 Tax=Sandarakinorhabdus sp. AAP62 TaxID=1248916 RepID=UPI0003677A29|nr:acyl-CoA thioesterase [Sandarakinorhabdus sp. AAP62]
MKDDPRRRQPDAYPDRLRLETRFGDMDVNGHLNNVAFARLFEETRVRFLRFGPGAPPPDKTRSHVVVAHVAIDYLAEGDYPAPVTVTLAISRIGSSSFTVAMAAFQDGADGPHCIALCDSILVHREPGAAPSPIPPAMRERLEALRLRG